MLCQLFPWLIALGSSLLGGAIGWYLFRNRKYFPLFNDFESLQTDHNQLQTDHSQTSRNLQTLRGHHETLQTSHDGWKLKHEGLTADHTKLNSAKLALNNEFDGFKTSSASTIAALNADLNDWKSKHTVATKSLDEANKGIASLEAELAKSKANWETQINDSKNRYAELKTNFDAATHKNQEFTVKVNHLTTEKTNLDQLFSTYKTENTKKLEDWTARYETVLGQKNDFEAKYTGGVAQIQQLNNDIAQAKT
ncbi:MAG: hypothetical protein RL757_2933, partial [Bacteroidota bacterium]